MMSKYHFYIFAFAALLLTGCDQTGPDQPRNAVDKWLEEEIADVRHYPVSGVSEKVLVNYRILKSVNGIVTVELTFKSLAGGDLVRTRNFHVNKNNGNVEMLD
jgi:hypothetical protein